MASPISEDMLQALLSLDAAERKAAEEQLQATSVLDRITAFVQELTSSTSSNGGGGALLHMVAVLLRRDILKITDAVMLQSLVSPLLHAFANVHSSTKNAVGNCLAEICSVLELTGSGAVSAIVISQILTAIATQASQGDLPCLALFSTLAERAPESFAQIALPSLAQLVESLVKHPVFHVESEEQMDPNWPNPGRLYAAATEVITATALATVGGIGGGVSATQDAADTSNLDGRPDSNSVPSQLGSRAFLPLLLLNDKILVSNHEAVAKVLPLWMQAAQSAPDLFVGSDPRVWERTVQICLQISAQDHDIKLSIQSIHVLNNLVSHLKSHLPDYMRQTIMQSVIPRLLNILLNEVDSDIESWAAEPVTSSVIDKDTFSDDDGEAQYAYEQLQAWIRTSPTLAMSMILPLLEHHLHGDWSHQWAATIGIQACAEEAPITFTPHCSTALQAALQLAGSSNPRVQYQAIQLLCILCETGNSIVWEHFGERILQALQGALASQWDRIKAMACTALVAYCRPEAKDKMDGERYVAPYLMDLLRTLVKGPMSGPTIVQSRAVQAVICLAYVSGPALAQYYSSIMPVLLTLAQQAKSNEYEDVKLQTTAIEAATIVGQSLGDENCNLFEEDAIRILQWIIPVLQQDQGESSNVPMGQLLSACARIATVAGPGYAVYADAVVPHLIRRVQVHTDVEIAEGDVSSFVAGGATSVQVDEEAGEESLTVAVPGRGLTKLTINTTKIEEKTEAIRGIYEHAVSLEGSFARYAQSCFEVLFPLIKFQYSADVRSTSAQSIAAVYEASCSGGEETGDFAICRAMLPKLVLELAQAVSKENDMEALYAVADGLHDILYCTYNRDPEEQQDLMVSFSPSDAKTMVQLCLRSALVPCLQRRAKITDILLRVQNLSGEDEKESYEACLREEDKLLTALVDSIGYTVKLFRESFYPVFKEEIAPILGPYLSEGLDMRARLAAVCLFVDCVEFCGRNAASDVAPSLLNGILLSLDETSNGGDIQLKEVAVYGIIQLARYAPGQLLAPKGQLIANFVSSHVSRREELAPTQALFENCVSAVASLFLIGQAPLQSSGLLPAEFAISTFISNLPLTLDSSEAKICHEGFCELVLSGKVDMDSNCSTIVRTACQVLHTAIDDDSFVTRDTYEKLVLILGQVQNGSKSNIVISTLSTFPESVQDAIKIALQ